MITVSNQFLHERIKLCIFRSIAEQLSERHLITEEEYQTIDKQIDQMEIDLIAGKNKNAKRERTLVEVNHSSLEL